MGESNTPLFAYVDETGNTGHNLFDEAQPDFLTTALITKGNFDARFKNEVRTLATRLGASALHGNELGMGQIERIADPFLAMLVRAQASFFVSRVEKKYLLCTKLFDSIFDSGENAAVAWHHYNFRALRLMLTFKLAMTVDEDTARLFWRCILARNESEARGMLVQVCENLKSNLDLLPDQRSREVLGEGLDWARLHPESIQIYTDRKLSKQGHFPNLVAFANLLDGLESFAKERNRRVATITHDRQSEFEKTLAMWHELYSNASPETVRWAGESYSMQRVVGSEFQVCEDSTSPGIQVADVVLWLYSQYRKEKKLAPRCAAIVRYVLSHGWENDFSFSGVSRSYEERFGAILSTPLSAEKEAEVRRMLEMAEERRQSSMARYEVDKLPPFMRPTTPSIEGDVGEEVAYGSHAALSQKSKT